MWRLFEGARALAVGDRASYLAGQCEDEELRREVRELLEADANPPALLGTAVETTPSAGGGRYRDRLLGRNIGPYRLDAVLGEGGMGSVYRATQAVPIRRQVALKLIKQGMDTREVVRRFEAERQTLALMDHPNIAKVHDAGATDEGLPFFVMELVEGEPITRFCDRHRLTLTDRLELMMRVCAAVQHAHQKGIMHRDIKPSNVLVRAAEDGAPLVKVIDFGIAKLVEEPLDGGTGATLQGRLVGTPEYMSPEQAALDRDIDTRTDVYSLGVLLYQLLTGRLPFESEEEAESGLADLLQAIRERRPSPPSRRFDRQSDANVTAGDRRQSDPRALRRQLAGDLDWIVLHALEKDRAARYATPSELAADLRRYLEHEPVLARPPSRLYRARKFVRRHRFAVASTTIAFLLVVASALGLAVQSGRLGRALERAELVSSFLVDVFEVADPNETSGSTVTAREILDRGAARISDELESDPELRAALLQVMGRVYGNLGLYREAEDLFRQALAARQARFGERHRDVAESLYHLGVSLFQQGSYDEAQVYLRRSLELRRALGEGEDVATTVRALGWVLHELGDLTAAGAAYGEALTLSRSLLGEEDAFTAGVELDVGVLYSDQGDYGAAEPLLRHALEVRLRALGEDDVAVFATMGQLGWLLRQQGELDEAEELLMQSVEGYRRILGTEHPSVAGRLTTLAAVQRAQGDLAAAARLHEEAVRVYRDQLGPTHSYTAAALNNLAGVRLDEGNLDAAEARYREALAIWSPLGDAHPNVADVHHNLGRVHLARGDTAAAERALRRALELDRKLYGERHPKVAGDLHLLGEILRLQGRVDEARRHFEQALELRRELLPEGHPDLTSVQEALAGIEELR